MKHVLNYKLLIYLIYINSSQQADSTQTGRSKYLEVVFN